MPKLLCIQAYMYLYCIDKLVVAVISQFIRGPRRKLSSFRSQVKIFQKIRRNLPDKELLLRHIEVVFPSGRDSWQALSLSLQMCSFQDARHRSRPGRAAVQGL